ncbi:MAG: extracellular solute-binding protein [Synechococcales cyanobacterium C42_A2020_086]|nr:extracellular solute-binding protein [Synechococcales cyanobacterium C42_A2020_086]
MAPLMLNRRSLLLGAAALAANSLLTGCRPPGRADLRVQLLQGSVPPQLLQEFRRRSQAGVALAASEQLDDLFELLQAWKQAESPQPSPSPASGINIPLPLANRTPMADLLTLGDFWLTAAIQQNLIQPLRLEAIPGWQQLPAPWQQLVRRNARGQLAPDGDLWAAPYRWGTLMLAYHVGHAQSLGWTPTDWQDLWRPELAQRIALPDHARAVIGLTLKKLGQSVNTEDLSTVANVSQELQMLNRQTKFYSSTAYLQPLLLGDCWVAVGWSTEILPVLKRDPRIAAVVPQSGTVLTADLWVHPAPSPSVSAPPTSPADPAVSSPDRLTALNEWIGFYWQPEIANQLSLLSLAASPVVLQGDRSRLPSALQNNLLLLPAPEVMERSEFLLPLPAAATEEYRRQWVQMRQRV